mmetsp:Transcript_1553/g.1501  ORF Transcript_1553/g.1501 Transcript_1553/m.1501 type:complete len:122 (+) Transcript_1553:2-367(+)
MFGAFSARRKRLIARARRMGFRWKVTSPQRRSSGFLVDGGCIILSRLRIVRSRAIVYQPGVFSDQLAAKGALYALLNPAPGVFIHLFSTPINRVTFLLMIGWVITWSSYNLLCWWPIHISS